MKQTIAVLFGGRSSEHEISVLSAANVLAHIDREKYEIIRIGITKDGAWKYVKDDESVKNGSWVNSEDAVWLLPDAHERALLVRRHGEYSRIPLDCAFPVLHGLYGEDGTVQGLFEMADIPYVGCGVLASAVGMDKFYTKQVVQYIGGIRQAAWVPVTAADLEEDEAAVIARVEKALPYPVFVKPSRAGSSCGVSRADDREELKAALELAARHDRKILVEEQIRGRELECAVFSDGHTLRVSGVGEILSAAEFYDYDAKYNNPDSQTNVHPALPEGAEEQIREAAAKIFTGIDGFGLSRVDFFLDEKGVVFNEINTLPGFTAISMYPMLFEAAGTSKDELVQALIDAAFAREAGYYKL